MMTKSRVWYCKLPCRNLDFSAVNEYFVSTVLYVVLFHFMFCFKLCLGLKMFDAAFRTLALQIFTPQLLPQLRLPQPSIPQSRVCHCFIILQCRNLDFGIENYGAEVWIAALSKMIVWYPHFRLITRILGENLFNLKLVNLFLSLFYSLARMHAANSV